MQIEKKLHDYCYFVTLTYSEQNLFSRELQLRDLQSFFKYMRRYLQMKDKKYYVRYFAAGEYGSRNGRPHFHAIIFTNYNFELKFLKHTPNGSLFECDDFNRYWKHKGYVWVAYDFDSKSFGYISSYSSKATSKRKTLYALKKFNEYRNEYLKSNSGYLAYLHLSDEYMKVDTRKPEFITMSRGLGASIEHYRSAPRSLLRLLSSRKTMPLLKQMLPKCFIKYHYSMNYSVISPLHTGKVFDDVGDGPLQYRHLKPMNFAFSWYNDYILERLHRQDNYFESIKNMDILSEIEYSKNKYKFNPKEVNKWKI